MDTLLADLKDIVDLSPDGIVVLDDHGVIVDANQSFLSLIERSTLPAPRLASGLEAPAVTVHCYSTA